MDKKNTLVVNLYAGPGAGKTTCAWLIAGELKKRNIVTEYVSEYAKELVWDKRFALLDGSYENQMQVIKEQEHRLSRLRGSVEVIVTDSPLLMSNMYIKERQEEYEKTVRDMYEHYNNFNLFINRGEHFEKEGRMHNLQESRGIDNQIKQYLDAKHIYYGNYYHSRIPIIVDNVQATLSHIKNQQRQSVPKENSCVSKRLCASMEGLTNKEVDCDYER